MTHFNVLVDTNGMHDDDLKLVVSCLSSLLYSFTSKHQKKTLFSFEIEPERRDALLTLCIAQEIGDFVACVDTHQIGDIEKGVSVLVDFRGEVSTEKIMSLMASGVPFLGLSSPERKEILDNTCSILVPNKATSDTFTEICSYLKMLYFDPEVRKILRKGALKKSKGAIPVLK